MRNWEKEGVVSGKPGPQWANKYSIEQIEDLSAFMAEYKRRARGNLGAFWPLEWRLVVEWIDGLRRAGWGVEPHGTHVELWGMHPPYSLELNPGGEIRIVARDEDTD